MANKKKKRIPYGISDFEAIQCDNYYYVDKTGYIPLIEDAGRYLFLIRPRRFGKSLWLSVLESYYDIAKKDKFDEIFTGTSIRQNPTDERNSYLTMNINFSLVNPDLKLPEESFEIYMGSVLSEFIEKYRSYFDKRFVSAISSIKRAIDKINHLFLYASRKEIKLYFLIDEYDNFANTILAIAGQDRYQALTHGKGFFRYFFNVLKGGATGSAAGLSRLFITGVSPLTMDDVTSGFNIGMNISMKKEFNELLGFTGEEVIRILEYYKCEAWGKESIEYHYEIMSNWYNNYRFAKISDNALFNTDMVLYYAGYLI